MTTVTAKTDELVNFITTKNNEKQKNVKFCIMVDNDSEEEYKETYYQNKYIVVCPVCEEHDCHKKECGDIIDDFYDRMEYWASN